MTAEHVICMAIYILAAFIMFVIGIAQVKSREPVGFYSGEKPPEAGELTDVHAWNVKHGRMWIAYGAFILLSCFPGVLAMDSALCRFSMIGGLLLPLVLMVCYHRRLLAVYRRNGRE